MMFGTNTTAEIKAFRSDLNRHLDAEAAKERQNQLIEEEALYLVEVGQEFHPWTFEHFEEAISNAPNSDRKVMFATIASAVDLHLNNHHANSFALLVVKQLVEKYWLTCAKHEAKKNG